MGKGKIYIFTSNAEAYLSKINEVFLLNGSSAVLGGVLAVDFDSIKIDRKNVFNVLRSIFYKNNIDFIVDFTPSKKKLFAFDMDSTTVTIETMDEYVNNYLTDPKIKQSIQDLTNQGMAGKIDFLQSFKTRISILSGMDTANMKNFFNQVIKDKLYTKGVKQFVKNASKDGISCVLLSGGLMEIAKMVGDDVGFIATHASVADVKDNKMLGTVSDDNIITDKEKLRLLLHYKQHFGLDMSQVVSLGDGSNDIPMLNASGLGIAYKPKKIVAEQVENQIHFSDMVFLSDIFLS